MMRRVPAATSVSVRLFLVADISKSPRFCLNTCEIRDARCPLPALFGECGRVTGELRGYWRIEVDFPSSAGRSEEGTRRSSRLIRAVSITTKQNEYSPFPALGNR